MTHQPCITLRDGKLKISVWENKNDDGNVYYGASLIKAYKQGEAWKETTRLNGDDLLKSARLMERTYDAIIVQKQSKDA